MQKLQNKVSFTLKYYFYYKPLLNNKKISNKIFLKNFLFILLFLEYFNSKKNFKIFYLFKKSQKNQNKMSIIRSPQRNKNSQIKLKVEQYCVSIIISFVSNITYFSFNQFKFFKDNFPFFESSLFFLKNINFLIFLKKKSLFLYC